MITASEVSKKPGAVHWDAVPYCEITAEDLEKYRLSKAMPLSRAWRTLAMDV